MPKQAGSGQAPPYTHTHECQGWTRGGTRPEGTGIGTGTGTGMGTGGESCPPVAAGRTAPLAAPTLPGPGSRAAGTAPGRAAAPVRDGGWMEEGAEKPVPLCRALGSSCPCAALGTNRWQGTGRAPRSFTRSHCSMESCWVLSCSF